MATNCNLRSPEFALPLSADAKRRRYGTELEDLERRVELLEGQLASGERQIDHAAGLRRLARSVQMLAERRA
jgi:hypothetical protein